MGATAVLLTAADTPPAMKSSIKFLASNGILSRSGRRLILELRQSDEATGLWLAEHEVRDVCVCVLCATLCKCVNDNLREGRMSALCRQFCLW